MARSLSTPGIDWSNFTRSDWKPLGGKTRRYENRQTGKTISRVAWMRHYGNLGKLGFSHPMNRAKIEKRINPERQLSRPARGRRSIRSLPADMRKELNEIRLANITDNKLLRVIKKEQAKVHRYPKKINASTFPKRGAVGRTIVLPINHEAIETVRSAAEKWGHVFGYTVGINFINLQDGSMGSYTFMKLRAIAYKFSQQNFDDMLLESEGKSYLLPISIFIHLALSMAWVEKYRNKKGLKR